MRILRHLASVVRESLAEFPAVLVTGARQVGKSTLAQSLADDAFGARYLTLDDRAVLDAATADPDGFLQENEPPLIIDEVQRAPDLLRALKLVIDRHRRPGMYLLTGSANVLTLARVAETLAGRIAIHELSPFAWSELAQLPAPRTIDDLFRVTSAGELVRSRPRASTEDRTPELKRLLTTGGFPTPALMASARARRVWFASYRQTYLERDLRDLANLEHVADFGRLLTTLALRTGGLLNTAELARDIGLPLTTLRRYFGLLDQTYQVFVCRPYVANVAKRLVKTPKVYLGDPGLCCHLSALDSWEAVVARDRVGALLETFVFAELRKLLALTSAPTDLWFFRTHAGHEVDFLLERGGDVVGLEVKWGTGIAPPKLAGLKAARAAFGSRWRLGVLAYGGTEILALDDRTIALPFGVLLGREPAGAEPASTS